MANKVIDIGKMPFNSAYGSLSQTPKNYDGNNFYIRTLQQKVDAEWEYRPNLVSIEYEDGWNIGDYWTVSGYPELEWKPIEVVVQQVKSDKGTDISEDCRRFVFKNIREDRFRIGSKFRFATNYDPFAEQKRKNVWLVTNRDDVRVTSSVVAQRCNGTLGSVYEDAQGVSHYHYEPVILGKDLSSTSLYFNEVAVSPQSGLVVVCQHNRYTSGYKLNQRFVVGYDEVYRVKAINKFYSNSTNDPMDIGLMRIYMEITEKSHYDDFVNRIAYEEEPKVKIDVDDAHDREFRIEFSKPDHIPANLGSEIVEFAPVLKDSYGSEWNEVSFNVECVLDNWPASREFDQYDNPYFELKKNDNTFSLRRKKLYPNGDITVKCFVPAEGSPTGAEISSSFKMTMRGLE